MESFFEIVLSPRLGSIGRREVFDPILPAAEADCEGETHFQCSSHNFGAMEHLFEAYSNTSDEDNEEDEPQPKRLALPSSTSKRPEHSQFQPMFRPSHSPDSTSEPQKEIMVPGRYISKRERALMSSAPVSRAPESFLNPSVQSSTGICLFFFFSVYLFTN